MSNENESEGTKSAIEWARREQQEYDRPHEARALRSSLTKEPVWVRIAREQAFRRGFVHGVVYASQVIEGLRDAKTVQEIADILDAWGNGKAQEWRYSAARDVVKTRDGEDETGRLLHDHPRINCFDL